MYQILFGITITTKVILIILCIKNTGYLRKTTANKN